MQKIDYFSLNCNDCAFCRKTVFAELPEDEIELLTKFRKTSLIKKGEVIFHEDSKPYNLFCILDGKVKLFKTGDEGKEQIVRFAKSGDIIGYRSLLGNDSYKCSASAIEDSYVCIIPKEIIEEIFDRNMFMYKKFIYLLSRDLRQAEITITELAQKPVRERVAECILNLKLTYGLDNDGYINVKLSREEMASIVGTATETVIRLLSEFKKDNIIEMDVRLIKILDESRLQKVANFYL